MFSVANASLETHRQQESSRVIAVEVQHVQDPMIPGVVRARVEPLELAVNLVGQSASRQGPRQANRFLCNSEPRECYLDAVTRVG